MMSMIPTRLPLVLLLLLVSSKVPAPDAAGGAGATGITVPPGFLAEPKITLIMTKGAMNACLLTTVRISGVETCQIGPIPMFCTRFRNNWAYNLMDASDKRNHYPLLTVAGTAYIAALKAKTTAAAPLAKKFGLDEVSWGIGSGRVFAHTQAPPATYEIGLRRLLPILNLNTLCIPQMGVQVGYTYYSEGDDAGPGVSMWRGIISPYYLNSMTSGMSFLSKAIETAGLCSLDGNFIMCLGGFGTKYPTAADIGAGSPALRLITGMWRAQEVTAAPLYFYGVYQVSLGAPVHAMLHMPTAMAAGMAANSPTYSPGSYMQWLYPGRGGSKQPVGVPEIWCLPLGAGPGTAPPLSAQMASETINKTYPDENTLGFAYWSRWTCCNWCMGSTTQLVRDAIPEQSIRPTLTRIP